MNTKEYIFNQYKMYPKLELQDILKFIYQSSYGCEHLVSDYDEVKSRIEKEPINPSGSIEELDAMGERGKLLMKDKYSIEAVASQMKAVYEWILGNFTRPNFVFIK